MSGFDDSVAQQVEHPLDIQFRVLIRPLESLKDGQDR